MSDYKPIGPGHPTGAEGNAVKSDAGNHSYYPGATEPGYVTGGEAEGGGGKGSSVPSRPNPQAGNLSGVKSDMVDAVKRSADYGGHGVKQGGVNATGPSILDPEGERTSHEDGQYGEREERYSGGEPLQAPTKV